MISLKGLLNEGEGLLKGSYIDTGLHLANLLRKRGFAKDEAAAIVGNMWAESTFNPSAQGAGGDFGLLQWLGIRKKELMKFAKKRNTPATNLNTQLDFIKYEMLNEYDGTYAYESRQFQKIASGKSAKDKAYLFAKYCERPVGWALERSKNTRMAVANQLYDLLIGKKPKQPEKDPKKKETHTSIVKLPKIYTVKSGDSLSVIAVKHKTTVDKIKKLNKLKSDLIKPGQKLIVK